MILDCVRLFSSQAFLLYQNLASSVLFLALRYSLHSQLPLHRRFSAPAPVSAERNGSHGRRVELLHREKTLRVAADRRHGSRLPHLGDGKMRKVDCPAESNLARSGRGKRRRMTRASRRGFLSVSYAQPCPTRHGCLTRSGPQDPGLSRAETGTTQLPPGGKRLTRDSHDSEIQEASSP